MNKDIRIITLGPEGYETDNRDFDTMKDARKWVKDAGLSPAYWENASESEGYHIRNVQTLQLHVNGEIIQDWFPKWASIPA